MGNIGRLELSVFICGAALMAVELVGTRIMAPYLGVSLYSWASVIAVVMGSLSAGYWYGGRMADRNPSEKLFFAIVLFCGASVILIPFVSPLAMLAAVPFGSKHGPLVASIILFAPPSFLFGLISPFAVRLKAKEIQNVGGTAGSLYAISTMGSIAGTLATGFVFIPEIGIKTTLLITSLSLMVLGLYFLKNKVISSLFMLLFLSSAVLPDYTFAFNGDIQYQGDSAYYHLVVTDINDSRYLMLDADIHTVIDLNDDSMAEYARLSVFSQAFVDSPEKIVLIGTGGGLIGTYFLENTDSAVDAVEIDPEVIVLAKDHFGFKEIPGRTRVFIEDARVFLNQNQDKYDIIFVDVFSSKHSMPYHLTTVETVKSIKSSLKDDGVVAVNVISAAKGEKSAVFRAIHSTYSQVFAKTYVYLLKKDPEEIQNVIFFACNSCEPDKEELEKLSSELFPKNKPVYFTEEIGSGIILTDDHAPIESLVASSMIN